MKTKLFFLLFASALASPVQAAFDLKPAGASSASLGGAQDAASEGAISLFANPAGLGLQDGIEWISFYSRLYSLKDLSLAGSAASARLPIGVFGIAYSQFGERIYQEKEAAATYAIALSQKISLGVTARGYSLNIDDFGSARALGLDAGLSSLVHPRLRISILAKNANRPAIGRSNIPLPTGAAAGGAMLLAEGIRLYAEVQAIEPDPVAFKSGLEFSLGQKFILRGGVRSRSVQFSGGFGLKLRGLRLDYGYAHSLRLPGTHQISLGGAWGLAEWERKRE